MAATAIRSCGTSAATNQAITSRAPRKANTCRIAEPASGSSRWAPTWPARWGPPCPGAPHRWSPARSRGDVRHVFAAPDRARERLGFTARTGLEAGTREFAGAVLRQRARASG
jgi:nucleoside-diphosphate-sugar epimerase